MIRTWLRLWFLAQARACFFSIFFLISVFSGFAGGVPVGIIAPYCASNPPSGWLWCNGDEVGINARPDLFAVIGYTYGSSGGGAYFNLPNLCKRVPVGMDPWTSPYWGLAKTGGVETVTLTVNQMPAHTHGLSGDNNQINWTAGSGILHWGANETWAIAKSATTQSSGGGQFHDNMPPYLTVNYIIKAEPDEQESFFGDLEEIELWNVKIDLWLFGGICAVILSVCFFLRR